MGDCMNINFWSLLVKPLSLVEVCIHLALLPFVIDFQVCLIAFDLLL